MGSVLLVQTQSMDGIPGQTVDTLPETSAFQIITVVVHQPPEQMGNI